MNAIQSYGTGIFDQRSMNPFIGSVNQYSHASSSQLQDKDITILTADGDRVTISSDYQSQSDYQRLSDFTYQKIPGMNKANGLAAYEETQFSHESSRTLSISVEGDLSERELKDIRKTLKTIDHIMDKVLNGGDPVEGMAKALTLLDLDTISGFSANYRFEETLSIEQAIANEVPAYSKDGLMETAAPVAKKGLDYLKTLVDEMVDTIKASGVKPTKLVDPIKQLFSLIRKDLAHKHGQNHMKSKLTDLIESKLMKTIHKMGKNVT